MGAVATLPRTGAHVRTEPRRSHAGLRWTALSLLLLVPAPVFGLRVSLMLLGVLGFSAAVVGLRHHRLGLWGIGLLCVLDPMMQTFVYTGGVLRWNTLNYWLLVVTLLFLPALLRRRDLPVRLLLLVVALLATELVGSADRFRGAQDLFGIVAMLGLLVYAGRRRIQGDDWFWLGISAGALSAAGGALFYMQRMSLPAINPNAWAAFPVSALFLLALALPFAPRHRHGSLAISVLVAISVAWVFLSGSRGNMLLAIATVGYIFLALEGVGRRATLAGVAALVLAAAAVQFADLQARALARVGAMLDSRASLNDRTSHRAELALAGWYVFTEHPLGVGTGGFTSAWERLGRRGAMAPVDPYRQMSAHAGWVKILAENGVPGVVLFAAFVGSFGVVGLRWRRRRAALLGCFVSGTLALAFVSTEYQNKALWVLAAGAAVMLGRGSPLAGRSRSP